MRTVAVAHLLLFLCAFERARCSCSTGGKPRTTQRIRRAITCAEAPRHPCDASKHRSLARLLHLSNCAHSKHEEQTPERPINFRTTISRNQHLRVFSITTVELVHTKRISRHETESPSSRGCCTSLLSRVLEAIGVCEGRSGAVQASGQWAWACTQAQHNGGERPRYTRLAESGGPVPPNARGDSRLPGARPEQQSPDVCSGAPVRARRIQCIGGSCMEISEWRSMESVYTQFQAP